MVLLSISENYGNHLGFSDNDYKDLGVEINNDKEILESGDIIVQLGYQMINYLIRKSSELNS